MAVSVTSTVYVIFRMLHVWQSIMLAASLTNLGGILSGPIAFFEFKDFILFMSLVLAFGKSKFAKCL